MLFTCSQVSSWRPKRRSAKFKIRSYSFKVMRRSLAPSQVLKRKTSPWDEDDSDSDGEEKSRRLKVQKIRHEKPNFLSKFSQHLGRQPFTSLCVNGDAKVTEHESRIKSILSKPFKVPIPNYQGLLSQSDIVQCLIYLVIYDGFCDNIPTYITNSCNFSTRFIQWSYFGNKAARSPKISPRS